MGHPIVGATVGLLVAIGITEAAVAIFSLGDAAAFMVGLVCGAIGFNAGMWIGTDL